MTDAEMLVALVAERDRLRAALRLALLWLPTEQDMPRASAEALAQICAIRAVLTSEAAT